MVALSMLKRLSDNLNALMGEARLSSSELARKTGVHATTIKRVRNNEQANPTVTTLLPLAQYFSISLSELVGDKNLQLSSIRNSANNKLQTVPLLSWRACVDYGPEVDSSNYQQIITEKKVSARAFALKVTDEDLTVFPKNSILLVEPEKQPESGDYLIIAKLQQGVAAIKKYLLEIDQSYLKSLVAGLGLTPLTAEYKILGVVIQAKLEL